MGVSKAAFFFFRGAPGVVNTFLQLSLLLSSFLARSLAPSLTPSSDTFLPLLRTLTTRLQQKSLSSPGNQTLACCFPPKEGNEGRNVFFQCLPSEKFCTLPLFPLFFAPLPLPVSLSFSLYRGGEPFFFLLCKVRTLSNLHWIEAHRRRSQRANGPGRGSRTIDGHAATTGKKESKPSSPAFDALPPIFRSYSCRLRLENIFLSELFAKRTRKHALRRTQTRNAIGRFCWNFFWLAPPLSSYSLGPKAAQNSLQCPRLFDFLPETHRLFHFLLCPSLISLASSSTEKEEEEEEER